MKRSINRFTQWLKEIGFEETIGLIMGILAGIVVGIIIFVSTDKVPATAMDYKELETQITAIQQNPDLLLKTNCKISINDDVITVDLKNDECSMTVEYNSDFEILSTSKADNYTFWLFALGLAVFLGAFVFCVTLVFLTIIIFILEILMEFIFSKDNANNSKKV